MYVVLSECSKAVKSIHHEFQELEPDISTRMPLYYHQAKHIDVWPHFVWNTVHDGEIVVVNVNSHDSLAHGFMKILHKHKLEKLWVSIGANDTTSDTLRSGKLLWRGKSFGRCLQRMQWKLFWYCIQRITNVPLLKRDMQENSLFPHCEVFRICSPYELEKVFFNWR